MEKISIIIANYNGRNFLETSIPSILKSNYSNFELIICDDASTDTSVEYLKTLQSQDNRIILLQNVKNKGAAATRNHAVSKATTEFLVLLDNDTEVDSNWLEPLINPLQTDPDVGGVQSTLINYHDRDTIQLIGTHLIPHTFWGIPLLAGKKVSDRPQAKTKIIALSAAMAVRKSVYTALEGFDELLAVYTEDIEFSLRIWLSGYTIINAPQSLVYHWTKRVEDRQTMFATKEKIYFNLAKNSLRSILKNYELRNVLRYVPFSVAVLSARMVLLLLKKDGSALKGTLLGFYWTITHINNTLHERAKIQSQRKLSDQVIMEKVFTKKGLISIYKEYFT